MLRWKTIPMIPTTELRMAPDGLAEGGAAPAPETVPGVADPDSTLGRFEAPRPAVQIVPEAAPGPDAAELQRRYDAQQAELDALRAKQDPMAAISKGFEGIAQNLQGIVQRPIQVQAPAQGPAVDEIGDMIRDLDANLLDNPGQRVVRAAQKVMEKPMDTLLRANFNMAERLVGSTTPDRELFTQYRDEIRDEFSRIDGRFKVEDPTGAYERAFDIVKGRHINEIFATRQSQAAAAVAAAAPPPTQAPARPAPATMATRGSAFAPQDQAGDGAYVITQAQADWVRDRMRAKGIAESNFDEYVEVLVEDGALKASRAR